MMSHKKRVLGYVLGGLLLFGGAGWAVGWLNRTLRGDAFWQRMEQAAQVANARADAFLPKLGYDPTQFTSDVGPGEGEEDWTVKYWRTPPQDYRDAVTSHGDVEVYLNSRGEVKRVATFEDGQERLLYGKDERIANGMTQDEVRARLGDPDQIGQPPKREQDIGDAVWKYQKNQSRTMRIEIWFKNKQVVWVGYFG